MQAPRLFSSFLTAALTCLLVLGTPNGQAEIRPDIGNGLALLDAQPNDANPFAAMPAESPRTHAMALMGESPLPPVPEKTKQRFRHADAGGSATCGVLQGSRRILCWGRNDLGQASPPVGKYRFVAMGENHGCALTTQGRLRCWGVPTAYPTAEQAKGRFLSVAAGDDHTCAIRSNHKLFCWGNNDNGELNVPPGKFRQVVARGDHSCGVTRDRRLLCWGEKAFTEYSQTIQTPVKKVATGQLHACALGTDGLAKCWGNGIHGENQAPADRFIDIVAGDWHTCGLRADHTALCWGRDQYGQTQVGMDKYRLIAGGGMQTCGILRGSRHITCHGSFANNEVWYPQDQNALIRASQQDGQVRPQLAFLSLFQGVSGLLASGIVNTGKMVDQKMEKWEGRMVPVQLAALITNMFLGWFGPKPVDPTIKIFDTLRDIQADIRKIEKGIDELRAQLNRTETLVLISWCDQQLDNYSAAFDLLSGDAYGETTGARSAYLQLLKNQEAVLTDSIDQQKVIAYPKSELDKFRNYYLPKVRSARTRLANSLIGANGVESSAFKACFKNGHADWKNKTTAKNDAYPFDDRLIYDHVYKIFRSALLMQGEMLTMEQDMEMQRAYQKLVDPRDDNIPPIDFNPQEHALGFCLYADERKVSSHPEYSPRWGDVATICQQNRDRIQNAYIEMVKQAEYMGGAYSDDQVVLSLTSEQLGLGNNGENNWLWLRDNTNAPLSTKVAFEFWNRTNGLSPFIRLGEKNPIPPSSDAGIYLRDGGRATAEWHAGGKAWDDVFKTRLRLRENNKSTVAEDLVESMSNLVDSYRPSNKLFAGLINKPFFMPASENRNYTYYFNPNSKAEWGSASGSNGRWFDCFVASGINKGGWYHPNLNHDARETLMFSGKVCNTEEMAAMLVRDKGGDWLNGIGCTSDGECIGIGVGRLMTNAYKPYATSVGPLVAEYDRGQYYWFYTEGPFQAVASWSGGRMYHLPVVNVNARQCKPSLVSSVGTPGVFEIRAGYREGNGANIPSICGEDMDKFISEVVPRPEFPSVPQNLVRLPEVNN